jgi:hypothetical protein
MGSLNSDGSIIQKQNETYRNIGGAISSTQQDLPNSGVILVAENTNVPFLRGTDADTTLTQYSTLLINPARKITDAATNSLVERQTETQTISASGNPEISLISVRDYADRHTGNRLVLGDAATDTVIERRLNTSVRPSGV